MSKPDESIDSTNHSRRKLLKCSASLAVVSSFPQIIQASSGLTSQRSLEFLNLHTDESLGCCYWANGIYVPHSLSEINHILRDHRANEIYAMDPTLLDLLYVLREATGSQSPYHVISAYRSPQTNEKLRIRSNGVARRSLHMQGKAIDIRLPDIELSQLRDTAMALNAGGVGYYQQSNFLHIDIGQPRSW